MTLDEHHKMIMAILEDKRLEDELKGKPPLNMQASETIPQLFDQINKLQARVAKLETALKIIEETGAYFVTTCLGPTAPKHPLWVAREALAEDG